MARKVEDRDICSFYGRTKQLDQAEEHDKECGVKPAATVSVPRTGRLHLEEARTFRKTLPGVSEAERGRAVEDGEATESSPNLFVRLWKQIIPCKDAEQGRCPENYSAPLHGRPE